ncbi:MAG TPA: hypothetical protein VFH68_03045 [Polyangia bacterium]|nr:hypothetical protein [Polyangia bacterium]
MLALACQSSPSGIRVDVDMSGGFKDSVKTLRFTVNVTGGFMPAAMMTISGATVSVDAAQNLVLVFAASTTTFTNKLSFRIDTQNRNELTVNAEAVGFDASNQKIASASATNAVLPKDDEARLSLRLISDIDGTNIDNTLLDLATAKLDRTITGPAPPANLTTVAVCDFEGRGEGDLVIGVPNADASAATQQTGAVYIVPHRSGNLDLGALGGGQEFHFFGIDSGDQLGASIACFDFDDDGADDLIVGAPGAYGGPGQDDAGRVYVLQGRSMVTNRSVNLAQHEAQIEFVGGAAGAALGTRVLAAGLQGGDGEVLIAAPGEQGIGIVHLVTIGHRLDTALTRVLSGTATGHITFSGIRPEAMAVGDLDGDGTTAGGSEIILGDPGFNLANPTIAGVGAVYVFRNIDPSLATAYSVSTEGGATGWARRILGKATNQALGASLLALNLAGAGTDLVVGSPGDSDGRGSVVVYEHQNDFFTLQRDPKWPPFLGATANERFGTTLASGSAHLPASTTPLHVGAPGAGSGAKANAGAVYTYARSSDNTMPLELRPRFIGGASGDRLGSAIAAGPIGKADGLADLVMLTPGFGGAMARAGVAYVRLAR